MVTQNLRVFAYIARRYNSAAESTSLLSSVASLATTTPGGRGAFSIRGSSARKGYPFQA